MIELFNDDCMAVMANYPDKYFDLAVVDPPYGIGKKLLHGGKTGVVRFHEQYEINQWDDEKPNSEYFNELLRVSKNQIIWGANYFIDMLTPSRGIIAWDKNIGQPNNFSHWEMAWTSFDCIARKVVESSNTGNRIHPTQKPVALYKWLLANYAKPGDKILDTHGGSMSSVIACIDGGFDMVCSELDKDYFDAAVNRINKHVRQMDMFNERPEIIIHEPTKVINI